MSNYGPPDGTPPEPPMGGGGTPPPPPPPPGGYGAPPPGAYGAPPQGASGWDLGAALSYGWNKFQANVGQIIVAALALFVAIAIMAAIGIGLQSALLSTAETTYDPETGWETTDGSGFFMVLLVGALTTALILIAAQIVGAGLIRASLDITEGKPFLTSTVFKFDKIGSVIVTSLIIAAATFVGTILCYLPGLIVGFVTSYSLYFVMDKGLAPVDAIKASVNLVKDNIGTTLIWYIVGGLVAGAGAIACGVGLLVTIPIFLIGTAFTYKHLTNQPVAP